MLQIMFFDQICLPITPIMYIAHASSYINNYAQDQGWPQVHAWGMCSMSYTSIIVFIGECVVYD